MKMELLVIALTLMLLHQIIVKVNLHLKRVKVENRVKVVNMEKVENVLLVIVVIAMIVELVMPKVMVVSVIILSIIGLAIDAVLLTLELNYLMINVVYQIKRITIVVGKELAIHLVLNVFVMILYITYLLKDVLLIMKLFPLL
jgi:hypothetical protein